MVGDRRSRRRGRRGGGAPGSASSYAARRDRRIGRARWGAATGTRRHGDSATARESVREADPYRLIYVGSTWYLNAYCHLRRDIRNFRLERMDAIETLDHTFVPPADLPTPGPGSGAEPAELLVRAHFDTETARWVRESLPYGTRSVEEDAAGLLLMVRVRHEQDIVQWLLGWGCHVRVLEPESLRRLIAREAAALLRAHHDEERHTP
jgi:predicted DNA-binding transcriptional regulator YafY